MKPSLSVLSDAAGLPAYWRACRKARAAMACRISRVSYGPARRQYVLVADPPAGERRPGHYAVYFHGGAWTFGTPEAFLPAARPWLRRGYRVLLPSYRRPPRVGLDRIVADCRAAIRHLAPSEAVADLQVGGMSAGAHLAALLASDEQLWSESGWQKLPSAVLACAGPLSLADLRPRRLFVPRYKAHDPLEQLPPAGLSAPRWCLLHGTEDGLVDITHSRKFHRKLMANGYTSVLHELPGGGHLDACRWLYDDAKVGVVDRFIGAETPLPPGAKSGGQ